MKHSSMLWGDAALGLPSAMPVLWLLVVSKPHEHSTRAVLRPRRDTPFGTEEGCDYEGRSMKFIIAMGRWPRALR